MTQPASWPGSRSRTPMYGSDGSSARPPTPAADVQQVPHVVAEGRPFRGSAREPVAAREHRLAVGAGRSQRRSLSVSCAVSSPKSRASARSWSASWSTCTTSDDVPCQLVGAVLLREAHQVSPRFDAALGREADQAAVDLVAAAGGDDHHRASSAATIRSNALCSPMNESDTRGGARSRRAHVRRRRGCRRRTPACRSPEMPPLGLPVSR